MCFNLRWKEDLKWNAGSTYSWYGGYMNRGNYSLETPSNNHWQCVKRNQIWESCAHSIAWTLIHLREGCERVAVHLRYTCDTPAIYIRYTCDNWRRLRDLRTLRATCASLETDLRDRLASICAQNTHLRAICGLLADLLCGSVIQSEIVPDVCDLGVMPFSTDSCCSGGIFRPTMEILGSFESHWNVKFGCHEFAAWVKTLYIIFRYPGFAIYGYHLWLFGISRLRWLELYHVRFESKSLVRPRFPHAFCTVHSLNSRFQGIISFVYEMG